MDQKWTESTVIRFSQFEIHGGVRELGNIGSIVHGGLMFSISANVENSHY